MFFNFLSQHVCFETLEFKASIMKYNMEKIWGENTHSPSRFGTTALNPVIPGSLMALLLAHSITIPQCLAKFLKLYQLKKSNGKQMPVLELQYPSCQT